MRWLRYYKIESTGRQLVEELVDRSVCCADATLQLDSPSVIVLCLQGELHPVHQHHSDFDSEAAVS